MRKPIYHLMDIDQQDCILNLVRQIKLGDDQHLMSEESGTKPKPYCFILMPFSKQFDDLYALGIEPSCKNAGAYGARADKQIFQETILQWIYNQIAKADIIIADMTERNPNVFYELGYAHALGKPTILLAKDLSDIPFDLKQYLCTTYDNIIDLIPKLTQRIEWLIDNSMAKHTGGQIHIELYLGSESLSSGKVIYTLDVLDSIDLNITVYNASALTLKPENFSIGFITSPDYHSTLEEYRVTKLPEGKWLHMIAALPVMFPGSHAGFNWKLEGFPKPGERCDITFRVFTEGGTRDFFLTVQKKSDQHDRQVVLKCAVEDDAANNRIRALEELTERWPDEDTRKFLCKRAIEDPSNSCREAAFEALVLGWQHEDVNAGLRTCAIESATPLYRGRAFYLLSSLHSEFGRILPTQNLDGEEPYLDPLAPIHKTHIQRASDKAMISNDLDDVLDGLTRHLGWDPTRGASPKAKRKKPGKISKKDSL